MTRRANVVTRQANCWGCRIPLDGYGPPGGGGQSRGVCVSAALLHEPNDDFSFSGLKTAVRYFLRDHPQVPQDPAQRRDLCASVQAAIVDVLVGQNPPCGTADRACGA